MVSFVLCAIFGFAAFATTPTVTDVVAKQRYPWNGLVDITCKVSGFDEETIGFQFVVAAVDSDSGNVLDISHVWVMQNGEKLPDLWVGASGDYQLLWDAKADLGEVVHDNMIVRVTGNAYRRGKVQLWSGGPYWATTNIGADKPWEYGLYFWWGDTVGYRSSSDGTFSFNFWYDNSAIYTYFKNKNELQGVGWMTSDGVLTAEHDAAHVHWGGAWRMPTYQELQDLCYNKCDWTWTTMKGVNGYVVCGRGDYTSNSIFLPCAGSGGGTSLGGAGSCGYYWSSVPTPGIIDCANELYFGSGIHITQEYAKRYFGFSVRPVQGLIK